MAALLLGGALAGGGCSATAKTTRTIDASLPSAESLVVRTTNGALTIRIDPTRTV